MKTFNEFIESGEVAQAKTTVDVICVGDIYPGRNVDHKAIGLGYSFPYLNIGNALDCDLLVGNLEGVVANELGRTYRGISAPKLSITTSALNELSNFDVVTIANNHISDFGGTAIHNTIEECSKRGIDVMGIKGQCIRRDVNGVKIAFIGMVDDKHFTIDSLIQGTEDFDVDNIKELKEYGDIVIINVHMGTEYAKKANQRQIDLAHRLIDAGADSVVFHHSHVIQNTEWYKGKFIAYSLGNWIFDQDQMGTQKGLSVKYTINKSGIAKIETAKHTIDDYVINYKHWKEETTQ